MSQQIRVEGLDELRHTLQRELPDALQGKAMQGALAQAARPIVASARSLAPNLTGRLRRAIYSFRSRASTRFRESRLITVRSGKRHGERDAFYWRWLEFGRGVIKASRSLGNTTDGFFGRDIKAVPAKPFLRPAFEANKVRAVQIFASAVKPMIEKVAARARARTERRLSRALRRNTLGL
jgi:HK97 gp10 family phage protein